MKRIVLVAATVAALIVPGILSAQGASASTTPVKFLQIGCYGVGCKNWGGYSINFVNPDPQNDPLGASAIWTVPGVSCTDNGSAITNTIAEWVGLGGVNSSNPLEQTGTAQQCKNGVASYYPWYEYTGNTADPNPVRISHPVYKGDNMAADVVEQGPGYFVTQLWDHGSTTHPKNIWYKASIWETTDASATPLTADWIFEDTDVNTVGGPPLPKYSPAVLFQNCYWAQDGGQQKLGAGSGVTPYQISTDLTQVATTGPLGADKMSFSVAWKTYG